MSEPIQRLDRTAITRRNRWVGLILVAIAALAYFGIQLRWGWSK